MRDAVIVGGGPAGLYAGARLAEVGFDVAVMEEHRSVGEPVHCTGVMGAEAFDEFDISRRSQLNELTTARFCSPSGRELTYSTRAVEAVVIDRGTFDRQLLEAARKAGAEIVRARVTSVEIDADGATVLTGTNRLRARACILACGASYALQRRLGLGMPPHFLQTAQLEVPATLSGDVELHFGDLIAPKGFGWAVPVRRRDGRHVRLGVMCDRDARRHFHQFATRLAPRWGVEVEALGRPHQKVLPLAPIPRTYGDRLLAVGDAAGLVKPTTGGGIYYSLISARLAAEVLTNALRKDDLGAATLEAYERRWRERLAGELRAQLSLRLLAQRMTDEEIEALFELARTDGVMPIVRRTASFNQHRRLILALLRHPPVRRILLKQLAF